MAERDSGQPESADGPGQPGREVGATSFLQRAVIRRRVRFLHRRREFALYDLGGFLFESHRLGQPHEEILAEKLDALTVLDDELALLQRALDLHEEVAVLSEPGIAACSHCGTLRDSAANFCPGCGRPAGETLPLVAASAATVATEPEGDFAAAPDAAAELTASDLSAGHETEIEAATRAEEPAAPAAPDATAEMPAVRLVTAQDADFAAWQAYEPAEEADLPTPQPQEPAEEADLPTPQPQEPAEEADLPTPQPQEPAEEAHLPAPQPQAPAEEAHLPAPQPQEPAQQADPWQTYEPAEEADLATERSQEPAEEAELAKGPHHEQAAAPAGSAGSDGQADETSTTAADAPS
jgi:hypothetical protein